jgi:hypothetical protein
MRAVDETRKAAKIARTTRIRNAEWKSRSDRS